MSSEVATNSKAVEGELVVGRPTKYNQDLADIICERLAMGESMRSVSRDEALPAMSTMFRWLREHKEFQEQYTRAKQESADAMAEEIMDISDDGSNDWMERNFGEQTAWVTNGEALQRSKLRVETRKWLMAKQKPKKYGDKLDIDQTVQMVAPILGGKAKEITDE